MTDCDALQSYLARLLEGDARTAFVRHVESCEACRNAVARATAVDGALVVWFAAQPVPPVRDAVAGLLAQAADPKSLSRLVSRRPTAIGSKPRGALLPPFRAWVVAAATLAVLLVGMGLRGWSWRARDQVAAPAPTAGVPVALSVLSAKDGHVLNESRGGTRTMEVPGDGQLLVRAGGDVLGLGARTRVEVLPPLGKHARVRLATGVVAVEAAHRPEVGALSVEAGNYTVTVVGTRFSVAWDGAARLGVVVDDGEVSVAKPGGGVRTVRAGQSLHAGGEVGAEGTLADSSADEVATLHRCLSATPEPPAPAFPSATAQASASLSGASTDAAPGSRPEPAPDDATIRQWLVDGETARAEQALVARLAVAPRESASWWLLGETRRRTGRPREAVVAYRKVIELGSPAEANRARYNAALLLEERLGDATGAIALYRAYLAGRPCPLEASAQWRLGRLLKARGDDAGRGVLEQLVRLHPSTPEAEQAARLLAVP
jgi:hypothetical protein